MMAPHAAKRSTSSAHEAGPYAVRISDASDDPVWDEFLEQAPGTPFTQTSCWGRARSYLGWQPIRVVVSENDQVVAGAQMLTRPLPVMGHIGFALKGPIVPADRPDLARLVIDEMIAMGRARKVQYLVVQPPRGGEWISEELTRIGFHDGALDIDYAYVREDLTADLPDLLARMSHNTRKYLRAEDRHVIKVRSGSDADLPIFNRLKDIHSARLGYSRREEGYYRSLWTAFAPRGHMKLLVAEHGGEPVCALLALPFGDTAHLMEQPWSGEHADLRPNEVIEWHALRWAKSEGFTFADEGAIPVAFAEAVLSGKKVASDPEYSKYSDSIFKLKFGGEVILDPPPLDYIYNPALRFAYKSIPDRLTKSEWMSKIIAKFKGTGT